MWPKADVPVFQLSIDYDRPAAFHYDLGRELQSLRERGLMILGSGNIVHNLRALDWQHEEGGPTFEWAAAFYEWAKGRLVEGDQSSPGELWQTGQRSGWLCRRMIITCPCFIRWVPKDRKKR